MKGSHAIIAALLLAMGIALAGALAGQAFVQARLVDRYVTVKGVAEREVRADLALWPLQVSATGNDLSRAQQEIDAQIETILAFLERHGLGNESVERQGLEVTDRLANRYGEPGQAPTRFVVTQRLMVRSVEPEKVREAGQDVGSLVQAGIVISSGTGYGPAQPTYLFTNLNDVKPEMIAEATAAAREAAEKFADDSGSRVGEIRRANQGVFVILPRDQAPGIDEQAQIVKVVRIVTTIDYTLDG